MRHLTSLLSRLRQLPLQAALPAAMLLAACTTPSPQPQPERQEAAATGATPAQINLDQENLRTIATLQSRIERVGAPLLTNNPVLCKGQARNLLGFSAKNKYSYSSQLADTVERTFGFGERLQVTSVFADSGAARAGIRRGDILVAAEGQPIPQGENAERPAAALLAPLVRQRSAIKLSLLRDGAQVDATVPLTLACAFSFELGNADSVNAYADGRRIAVTRGLVNFAQSDDELAFVLAREMAHNMLGHPTRQRMNATMDGIIDNLILAHPDMSSMTGMAGLRAYPQSLDVAADRLSLYLAARAGYDIEQAQAFWQRLSSRYPVSVLNGYTALHPATAARLTALEKTVAEIKTKQAAKQPLLP